MTMPELRFKSNELLREVSLSEVGNFYGGLSGKTKSDFGFGDSKFITYMNVFTNTIAKQDMCDLVMVGANEKQNLVVDGDILFTQSSETPEEVGMASVWTYKQKVYLNSFSFGLRVKNKQNVDPVYLTYLLRSPAYRKRISIQAQGISRYNLSSSRLSTLKVKIPTLEEQQKIAAFFTALDRKIRINEDKINFLEKIKGESIRGIFSRKISFFEKKDQQYPQWRTIALRDLCDFKNGISKSKKDFGYGSPFVNLQDVFGKIEVRKTNFELVNASEKEIEEFDLLKGDVLFVRSSVKPEGVGLPSVVCDDLKNTVYSGFLIRSRFKNLALMDDFKKYCFIEPEFRRQVMSKSTSSANTNINQPSLESIYVKVPSHEEQKKISMFLSLIDKRIELATLKLLRLRELKKSFMQQMFV